MMQKETPEADEKKSDKDRDVSEYGKDKGKATLSRHRFELAKHVLLGLGILTAVVVLVSAALINSLSGAHPDNAGNAYVTGFVERLLDIDQMTIPPIATLVLGYYFGNKS